MLTEKIAMEKEEERREEERKEGKKRTMEERKTRKERKMEGGASVRNISASSVSEAATMNLPWQAFCGFYIAVREEGCWLVSSFEDSEQRKLRWSGPAGCSS